MSNTTKNTKNKTLKGKGKELDTIVNDIIDICNDTIVEYKTEKALKPSGPHSHTYVHKTITIWNIIIDNIPTSMSMKCNVSQTHLSDDYILSLERTLSWDGIVYMEESDLFKTDIMHVEVKKDIINKNDITKKIIDLFSINNLSYCKCRNTFTEKDIFSKTVNYFDFKLRNVEECCVCYDKTSTQTNNCKHYICLECVSKLKTIRTCVGSEAPYFRCPMCREKTEGIVDSVGLQDCLSDEED